MRTENKLMALVVIGLILGAGIGQLLYDRDLDGIPNSVDSFPSNSSEWKILIMTLTE